MLVREESVIKNIRILLLLKTVRQEISQIIHPQAVVSLRLNGQSIEEATISGVKGFFLIYILIFVVATLVITLLGPDLVTAASSVAATLGTVGPGLGLVGPAGNYAWLSGIGKLVLCGCMLLGRLEIYTVLVLFAPSLWRK